MDMTPTHQSGKRSIEHVYQEEPREIENTLRQNKKRRCQDVLPQSSSPPLLPLEIWGIIFQFNPQNIPNLLLVCTQFHQYIWRLRKGVCLRYGASDDTLAFITMMNPTLTTLELWNNFPNDDHMIHDGIFSTSPGASLPLLPHLTTLILETGGALTNQSLSQLTSLTRLDLLLYNSSSQISGQGLISLTNLKHLDLGCSSLKNQDICGLTFLQTLKLGYKNKITNQGITPLINLTTLDLGFNKIITSQIVFSLKNLTTIRLGHYKNSVTIQDLIPFMHIQTLIIETLYIAGNKTLDVDLRILGEKRPDIQIDYDLTKPGETENNISF